MAPVENPYPSHLGATAVVLLPLGPVLLGITPFIWLLHRKRVRVKKFLNGMPQAVELIFRTAQFRCQRCECFFTPPCPHVAPGAHATERFLEQAARLVRFADVANVIRKVGPESVILSTDMGQVGFPPPPEGLAAYIAELRAQRFTQRELDRMTKENPARLLGLPVL